MAFVSAKKVPAFILGARTDSQGRQREWTEKEIDEAAEAYNSVAATGYHEAPILHGHKGGHAYGWIERAYREGKTLYLDLKNVVGEFAQKVNDRLHPKRSISFYPPNHPGNPTPGRWNINHLAYLPAPDEINPAVKGLPDHAFREPDDECLNYNFADMEMSPWSAVALIFQGMRDRAIETDGLDAANQQFPAEAIACIQAAGYDDDDDEEDEEEEIGMSEITPEQLAELQAKYAELEKAHTALQLQQERDQVTSFVEKLIDDRKLLPADKDNKIKLLLALPNTGAIEFSEGVTKSARQALMDDMAAVKELYSSRSMPTGPEHSPVSYTESSLQGEFSAEDIKRDRAIRAKATELGKDPNNVVHYAEAMTALGYTY